MITLIVACAENGAIGRDGAIPWHIPEDLQSFQRETLGGALIMGRKTWESLPTKPLPKRLNIVVSAHEDTAELVAPSVAAAVELAFGRGYHRVYGIGGARIYAEMLPLAHRLLISDVKLTVEGADAFFPRLNLDSWCLINERALRLDGPQCDSREYVRRGGS